MIKRLTVTKTRYKRRNSTILLFHNFVKSLLLSQRGNLKLYIEEYLEMRSNENMPELRDTVNVVYREKFMGTQERIKIN